MTVSIKISAELAGLCPQTALGILIYDVDVAPSSNELLAEFDKLIAELSNEYKLETVAKNIHIASTRKAYKALGKSPQEYRCAAEAMLRRIAKGTGLYRINNVVDVNNIISISSGYSIGSYDIGTLHGTVELKRAEDGAHYGGIGKKSVNIGRLPVLFDDDGPFGNPTSDSTRAMIAEGHHTVMSVIYGFDGTEGLENWISQYADLLKRFCGVQNIETKIITA